MQKVRSKEQEHGELESEGQVQGAGVLPGRLQYDALKSKLYHNSRLPSTRVCQSHSSKAVVLTRALRLAFSPHRHHTRYTVNCVVSSSIPAAVLQFFQRRLFRLIISSVRLVLDQVLKQHDLLTEEVAW